LQAYQIADRGRPSGVVRDSLLRNPFRIGREIMGVRLHSGRREWRTCVERRESSQSQSLPLCTRDSALPGCPRADPRGVPPLTLESITRGRSSRRAPIGSRTAPRALSGVASARELHRVDHRREARAAGHRIFARVGLLVVCVESVTFPTPV